MVNAFNEAMDEEESNTDGAGDAAETPRADDLDAFRDEMQEGTKTETIGIGVSPQMMAFYKQLRQDESVDVDPGTVFRDHLLKLAHRHEDVLSDAKQIYDIQNK